MAKVTIYTQVFNAGPYLRPCIDSVLAQTHTDWEHIIVDAGSTDGSVEILKEYAAGDKRVKFIQLPENRWSQYEMTEKYATGEYYASLDHDDWWDPEFLERLLQFMQRNDLDLAVTGVMQYFDDRGTTVCLRKASKAVVFTLEKFVQQYDIYGSFVNARWGNIMPTKLYLSMKKEYDEVLSTNFLWRSDTILMLKFLPHFHRIGIDNSAMQYYRMHEGSWIQQHDISRFAGQILFFETVEEFLRENNGLSIKNQAWLKAREIAEIKDTFLHIRESDISISDKMEEVAPILAHPRTLDCITCQCSLLDNWYETLAGLLLDIISDKAVTDERFQKAVSLLAPNTNKIIPCVGNGFFQQNPDVLKTLLRDDVPAMIRQLLELAGEEKNIQAWDLGEAIHTLIAADSPLEPVHDSRFFHKYPDICRLIFGGANFTALDYMTGLLLDGRELDCCEDFLHVFLNISAQLEQVPAFLFGKIRLAKYYFQAEQFDPCMEILNELDEMGAGEQEEVIYLQKQLGMKLKAEGAAK